METISKDANAVLSGVSPEARAYAIANAPGSNLTSGEARRLTSEFLSANSGAATQVYSAPNIAQTTTAPVAAPNLSDPFGLYNYYMNTPDITAAKESAKTAQAQLLERTKAAREQQQALGQNLQSTNRIRGNQQNAQQLATNDIQALNEAYTLAASNVDALTSTAKEKLAIAEQSRNEIKSLIAQTGGKAGISYADTYESAVAKADSYIKKQEKEAKKEAYKDSLKQTALQLGIKTAGKNTKELEKSLKKYYKSEREYSDKIKQIELQAKQKSLAGTGAGTVSQRTGAIVANAQTALLSSRGSDGKVDPGIYATERAKYAAETGDVTGFDKQFGGLLSKNEQSRLGVATTEAAEPKPLSAEATKVLENAKSGSRALDTVEKMSSSLSTRVLAGLPFSPGAGEYEAAKNEVLDVITRLRTGAAITKDEEDFYKKQLPTITDNEATRKSKIERFRTLFNSISNQIQPTSNDPLGLGI